MTNVDVLAIMRTAARLGAAFELRVLQGDTVLGSTHDVRADTADGRLVFRGSADIVEDGTADCGMVVLGEYACGGVLAQPTKVHVGTGFELELIVETGRDHKEGCPAHKALTTSTGVECEHGYDVCPKCDPCNCGAREPSGVEQPHVNPY